MRYERISQKKPITRPPGRALARVHPAPSETDYEDDRPDTVLRRCGRVGRIVGFAMLPVVLLAALAIVLVYVRLKHGPVSLSVLVAPIERGVNAELTDNRVKIGDALLTMRPEGGFELRLKDVSLMESDGDAVATAPLAAVEISAAGLWSGRFVPSRIELLEPRINLFYSPGGEFGLSIERLADDAEIPAGQTASEAAALPRDPSSASQPPPAARSDTVEVLPPAKIDIAAIFRDISARARRRSGASSFLVAVGARDASVVLDYAGNKSELSVPEFAIGLDHGSGRSSTAAHGRIASHRGSWTIDISTDEIEANDGFTLKASIRDLVPSALPSSIPPLALLEMFDMPIAADAALDISDSGQLIRATSTIEVGNGSIRTREAPDAPFDISGGLFNLRYEAGENLVHLDPSPVRWGDSRIVFSGTASAESDAASDLPAWRFAIDGKDGVFSGGSISTPSLKLDSWRASGKVVPGRGQLTLDDFRLSAGGGDVHLSGETVMGTAAPSARFEGTISPMAIETAKAIWPRALSPNAREWVALRIASGDVTSGTFRFSSGITAQDKPPADIAKDGPRFAARTGDDTAAKDRLSVAIEMANTTILPIDGVAPLFAPRTLMHYENDDLEVSLPAGDIVLSNDVRVPVKNGRFFSAAVSSARPDAAITFNVQSALAPVLQVVHQLPLKSLRESEPPPKDLEGKFDGEIKIKFPLIADLRVADVSVQGKGRIFDGRIAKAGGQFDVQGLSIGVDFTEKMLAAKGDALVRGVSVKLAADRNFELPLEDQPPFRISALLDAADRTQLGLDINDIVKGEIGLEILVQKGAAPEPQVKLRADLTAAELVLEPISWRKAPGRAATLLCDVITAKTGKTQLQNFKISGDDVAIEGWVGIGAGNKLQEFHFPNFNLNVVTRLEVQGNLGAGGVWDVKARGPTFDGRDFFRSLFSVGQNAQARGAPQKSKSGIELDAKINTVIGFSEVSMQGVELKLSGRDEKLNALAMRATLDGGAPFTATVEKADGPRRLVAQSTDAGQVMKIVDFYPNLVGGRLRIDVNLDGKGPAEKTGVLVVDNFRILGDPVVNEVVASAEGSPRSPGAGRDRSRSQVTREVYDFDKMRVPFSVGYGQFVMDDSYLKGPVVGATIRGKIDFKTRRINVGGTYIPLQGLNNALGGIPLLGEILSGSRSEGIFGITFAIQGPMSEPQVIVNPLSLLTPGFTREIMQMAPINPSIQARDDKGKAVPERGARSSSAPAATNSGSGKGRPTETIDGWSQTTKPARQP